MTVRRAVVCASDSEWRTTRQSDQPACPAPPGALKRAKVVAAKAETLVNALFNAQLRYLVETFEAAGVARRPNHPH